jgi:hypothetical protein
MSDTFLGTEEDELRARIDLLEATIETIGRQNRRLRSSLQLVADALDIEVWDARWTNRLMQAHIAAHNTLEDTASTNEATDAGTVAG